MPHAKLALFAALLATLADGGPAQAAKATECTKIGVCYCINDELKATILEKVDRFRQTIAEQRKAGKAVGYLSVPLTSAFGGNVLNPGTKEADIPKGTGTDYMLMWTLLLEGPDGMGEFDVAYFAGPQDFARFFGFDGNNDMAKLDAYFDKRVQSNPGFAKAVQGGLAKQAFRTYHALRASATVSRGAHDEWNIFRVINDRRRKDSKYGTPGQIPIVFDGLGVAPPHHETTISEGYVGNCPL